MGERNEQEVGQSIAGTAEKLAARRSPGSSRARAGAGGRGVRRTPRAAAGEKETKVDEKGLLAVNYEKENTGSVPKEPGKNNDVVTEKTGGNPKPPAQKAPKTVPVDVVEIPTTAAPETTKAIPSKSKSPAKKTTRRRTKKQAFDTTQVDAIIVGLSDYVAARPGCAHWKMTEEEVKTITEPLSNIIGKYTDVSTLTEKSDEIALVIAVIAVFVPRAFITFQTIKTKKNDRAAGFTLDFKTEEKEGKEDGKQIGGEERTHETVSGADAKGRINPRLHSANSPDVSAHLAGLSPI